MKRLFIDKGGAKDNIDLVEDNRMISGDTEVALAFNTFFKTSVNSLGISENKALLTETKNTEGKSYTNV